MRLHHFCRASDLGSIAEKGLYPHVVDRANHVAGAIRSCG